MGKLRMAWEIWRLERELKKLLKEGRRVSARAEKEKNPQLEQDWRDAHRSELLFIEWDIGRIRTNRLISVAAKLLVPIPAFSDQKKWLPTTPQGYRLLSYRGTFELQGAIRTQQKQRREVWGWWITTLSSLIALLIGLIGAVITLLTVLKPN